MLTYLNIHLNINPPSKIYIWNVMFQSKMGGVVQGGMEKD